MGTSSQDLPTKSPTSVLIKMLLDVPTTYIWSMFNAYDTYIWPLPPSCPHPPKKKCMHIHLGILHWDTNDTFANTYTSSVSVGDLFCHLLEVSSLSYMALTSPVPVGAGLTGSPVATSAVTRHGPDGRPTAGYSRRNARGRRVYPQTAGRRWGLAGGQATVWRGIGWAMSPQWDTPNTM